MKNNRLFRILLLVLVTFSLVGCSIFTSNKNEDQEKEVAKNTLIDQKEDVKDKEEDIEVIEKVEDSIEEDFTNFNIPTYSNSLSRKNNYLNNSVIVKQERKPISESNTLRLPNISNDKVKPIEPNKPSHPNKPAQPELPKVEIPKEEVPEVEIPLKKLNENYDAKIHLDKSLNLLSANLKDSKFGYGNEWTILALARSNFNLDGLAYDNYINNLVDKFEKDNISMDEVRLSQSTDNSRLILALSALGRDVRDVNGYNVLSALSDFNYVKHSGINGPIFALLALDTNGLNISDTADSNNQTTRIKLIDNILSQQKFDVKNDYSGWAFFGNIPDVDLTAMAIQALAPYYNDNDKVKEAIDNGLKFLSKTQNENGAYTSWGSESSGSVVQVIVALTELGIDPHNDEDFIKNGNSLVDALLSFKVEDGGFKNIKSGPINAMATQQGTYGLVAYDRYINDLSSLYDMTDVKR